MSLEVLKNIDPEALYRATKITVKDGRSDRYVKKDDNFVGQATVLSGSDDANDEYSFLNVGELFTSILKKVTQDGDNFIIETLNSVYVLEKL